MNCWKDDCRRRTAGEPPNSASGAAPIDAQILRMLFTVTSLTNVSGPSSWPVLTNSRSNPGRVPRAAVDEQQHVPVDQSGSCWRIDR
jgi:hypothetical protein